MVNKTNEHAILKVFTFSNNVIMYSIKNPSPFEDKFIVFRQVYFGKKTLFIQRQPPSEASTTLIKVL